MICTGNSTQSHYVYSAVLNKCIDITNPKSFRIYALENILTILIIALVAYILISAYVYLTRIKNKS